MFRTRIHIAGIAATLTLVASVALAVAPPAQAAAGDLLCIPPSSNTVNYSPALTATPQNVVASGTYDLSTCVSTTVPALTSGIVSTSTPAPNRSCLNLTGTSSLTTTITWNTGQTSTISTSNVVTVAGGLYTVTMNGTVTSGLFVGDTVVAELVGAATDIVLCTLGLGTVSTITTLSTTTFA